MKKERNVVKFFIDFYRRIRIPWWIYVLSSLCGIVFAEITLKTSAYLIRVNKGELYNSVIIGYVLLTVLNSLISFASNVLQGYANQRVILRSRNTLWRRILHMPVKDVEYEQPSTLISAVTNESGEAAAVINILFTAVASVYGLIRSWITLFMFQATLSLYMMVLIPLTLFVFFIVGKLQYTIMKKRYGSINIMTTFFSEHLSASKYIKVNSMEDKELQSGNKAINARYKADLYNTFMSQLSIFLNTFKTNISTVAIAFGGAKLINQGVMETTGINDFSTYMGKQDQYLAENLTQYQNLMGSKGALSHVSRLYNMPQEDLEQGEEWKDSKDKDIVFENVEFGYFQNNSIIHGLSVTIPSNKVTAIIGDNGCGKSTIMKLMQGFYKPSSGTIRVGENQVGKVKMEALRGQFSYVLQDNPLFAGTIRDNIAYGVDHQVTDEEIIEAAKAACIDEFIGQLPMGYDTEIGESGSSLSGGQKQRIAIARALMLNPEYLILDEAGASIDHETYEKIFDAITKGKKHRTVILISHDMREVMQAENIIVMDKGKIEASGTHDELIKTSRTYKEYMEKLLA